ncbi:MAG: T9SS type A sorting domain-containing protein [Saprospiraceae bacterium]
MLLIVAFLFTVSAPLHAQIKFEKDFNHAPGMSDFREWVEIDSKMYFSANDGLFGYELWEFDPATEEARRLTNIRRLGGSSNPENIVAYDGKVFFVAETDDQGVHLFNYNPQIAEVKNVSMSYGETFSPRSLAVYNGKLWFTAKLNGQVNLWNYDGLTNDFLEIPPPVLGHSTDFSPSFKYEYNNRLYFQAADQNGKFLLWSFGEQAGDFQREPTQFDNFFFLDIYEFAECDGELMLNMEVDFENKGWYHYDHDLDSCIYLTSYESGDEGVGECFQNNFWYIDNPVKRIIIYDPTTGQTSQFDDLVASPPGYPFSLKAVGENLYFLANSFFGFHTLSRYKPSINAVDLFSASPQVETKLLTLMEQGDYIYYFGQDGLQQEIFKYHTLIDELEMAADINQATAGGFAAGVRNSFNEYDGRIYFNVFDEIGDPYSVWSRGISTGDFSSLTEQLLDGEQPNIIGKAVELGGRLYFSRSDKNGEYRQLVSYKTGEDTLRWHLNIETAAGTFYRPFIGLTEYNGDLIFAAVKDYQYDYQLFRFNPDTETAELIPGTEQVAGVPSFVLDDKLYFRGSYANDLANYFFFSVDLITGTLIEIAEETDFFTTYHQLFQLGEKVAYVGRDANLPIPNIQVFDPVTGSKTTVLPNGYDNIAVNRVVDFQGKKWFFDRTEDDKLFSIDPTTLVCEVALDLVPFGLETSGEMVEYNDKLYFDGYSVETGLELFEYDPSTEEVQLVMDIYPGGGTSRPEDFAVIGDRLYFTATDGRRGWELWSLGDCFSVSLATIPNPPGQQDGQINIEIEGGSAPFTFAWNTGVTTQNLTNLSAGFYEATVTDATGCEATIFTILEDGFISNTTNVQSFLEINVYPNPASEIIQIKRTESIGKISASLFSFSGSKLWDQKLGMDVNTISISNFPNGIYFLVIRGEAEGVLVQKIIVQR